MNDDIMAFFIGLVLGVLLAGFMVSYTVGRGWQKEYEIL